MGRFNDLTGQRFRDLLVLYRVGTDKCCKPIWLCQCKVDGCGKKIEVIGSDLKTKKSPKTNCGCKHKNKLLGRKFGHLTVIERIGVSEYRQTIWLVRCVCKNTIEVLEGRLTNIKQPMTHCGCKTSQNMSDAQKSKIGVKNNNYKHGQSRSPEYAIEKSHQRRLMLKKLSGSIPVYLGLIQKCKDKLNYCVYCGDRPGEFIKMTTDHIVPISKGGINNIKNLITACLSCNSSKKDLLFIDWYTPRKNFKRQLDLIINDMRFDSLEDLTNYQTMLTENYPTH